MCKFGWKTCNVFDALGSLFVKYIGFVVTHLLVYENLRADDGTSFAQ